MTSPGLDPDAEAIPGLAADLAKKTAIFVYKQHQPVLWVTILGGTGTGKSTLFNALCGQPISQTGMERPKTQGPIAFAHENAPIEKSFPIESIRIVRHLFESDNAEPRSGGEDILTIIDHVRPDWEHLVLVDAPDLDSIASKNREMSRDLYLLSDAVVFVTSQEKYADQVPSQLLRQVVETKKPYFLLINKVQNRTARTELAKTLQDQGISVNESRIWSIDYEPSNAAQAVTEQSEYHRFASVFSDELSPRLRQSLRDAQLKQRSQDLSDQIDRLQNLLEKEQRLSGDWINRLNHIFTQTANALIQNESKRFTQKSRDYLADEIRRLFARYDVLAKPRQMIKELLFFPLQIFGFRKKRTDEKRRSAFVRLKERLDLSPMEAAVAVFNRSVLTNLAPQDKDSPLNKALRRPDIVLEYEEIRDQTWQEHEQLTTWLEEKFQELSRELPKRKKWGIYSTSILWGILLLSLETVIGGGFTVLDAVLDSAIAPFITKGAVELFAYREIQKIVRELSNRYQSVLLAALRGQHDLYKKCVLSLEIKKEVFECLSELRIFLNTNSTDSHSR